ncbi:hypothetical protein PENTCL1PPCAC_18177 [Pristionchus entomophagus]|uniref:Tudor domain-containing protein n=1 Tax=Pristionchus entomophagus TaxID=358040 RepID=A0AAV5TP97_9BILA|nr:hypothetical protein PENTCL1PPCAC_18177 [Pristionchus entomophagus]
MDDVHRRRDRSTSPIFSVKEIKSKTNPDKRVRTEEKELLQNGFYDEKIDDNTHIRCCKINRIPMITTAEVTVVSVISPSLIFVRIVNHIRDQLVLREPSDIVPLADWELQEFYYVLCPIEDRAYGRARILKIEPHPSEILERLVQLLLIDDGNIVWANSSSLVSMDPDRSRGAKDLAYHPWQIQAISLAGIYPKKRPKNRDRKWDVSVRHRLQRILDGFDQFKAKAVTLSVTNNDYGVASVVSLFGLHVQKEDEEEGEKGKENWKEKRFKTPGSRHGVPEEIDIGSMVVGALPYDVEMIRLYDGKRQERFEMRLTQEEKKHLTSRFMEDYRLKCIPDWKPQVNPNKDPNSWMADVELESAVIDDMTVEWMKSEKYDYHSRFFISLEGAHTNSPWEFYGRPIKMVVEKEKEPTGGKGDEGGKEEKGGGDKKKEEGEEIIKSVDGKGTEGDPEAGLVKLGEADAMLKGNTILKNNASTLDVYYSKDGNRKQVTKQEIKRVLTDGKRAFAICQAGETRAEYTGLWQRVEILQANEYAATVRFVDSGGTDMVMYGALFHIHKDHTVWRALCVQLCIHGLRLEGKAGETWISGEISEEKYNAIEGFRKRMREDLPMSISIYPETMIPRDTFCESRTMTPVNDDHPIKSYQRPGVLFIEDIKVHGRNADIIQEMCTFKWAKRDPTVPFRLKAPTSL